MAAPGRSSIATTRNVKHGAFRRPDSPGALGFVNPGAIVIFPIVALVDVAAIVSLTHRQYHLFQVFIFSPINQVVLNYQ